MSGRHKIATRFIVASMLVGLGLTAPTLAHAATTVNLDQWASTDKAWQNGNLNGNNSRYPEGGIVPFRLAMEGLKAGAHSIHINYDFTAGGHKAYDFLATWNVTNAAGKACTPSGGAISSMCPSLPASSSAAIPSDPFKANGLSVSGAEKYSGAPRRLTIWGGTITSISRPVHAGNVNGNSTADILVRFRSTGSAVLLAWGGHLAQSRYWDTAAGGARDGASLVSGAPWHMRTLQLDGAGNKNQDRSIQPSAIVGELPPQALAPTPNPTPRPPANPAPTSRPPSNPGQPGAPDPRPAAQDPGPLGTVPPTSTAIDGATTSGDAGLAYVLVLTVALAAVSVRAARGARSTSRAPD
jgi:hypothetical protein